MQTMISNKCRAAGVRDGIGQYRHADDPAMFGQAATNAANAQANAPQEQMAGLSQAQIQELANAGVKAAKDWLAGLNGGGQQQQRPAISTAQIAMVVGIVGALAWVAFRK